MQKTKINPEIFQELLDSAANANLKGQAQFYTPVSFATTIARALPICRQTLVDLQCGTGQLLVGAASHDTEHYLGCEIDPAALRKFRHKEAQTVAADFLHFAPLLERVRFRADLFTLNPPWSLQWPTALLRWLERSDVHSVAATIGLTADMNIPTIESTKATYCLALHFMTDAGEGLLIGNHSTVTSEILENGKLSAHVWAHLIVEGNPCTGYKRNKFETETKTSILYFARSHEDGPVATVQCSEHDLEAAVDRIRSARQKAHRYYHLNYSSAFDQESVKRWTMCVDEFNERQSRGTKPAYNLWLAGSGDSATICTYLSLFDATAGDLEGQDLHAQATSLHKLNGRTPFSLVLQRAERELLLQHAGLNIDGTPAATPRHVWKVDPKLQDAVRAAVFKYEQSRAPLYQLPEIQRLGYLEEHDTLLCKKNLSGPSGEDLYTAGQRYPVTTRSVTITRTGNRTNFKGEDLDVEYKGQELLTLITANDGVQYHFLEARLRSPDVKVHSDNSEEPLPIHFTLQDLVAHFPVPDVPDIATLFPDQFRRNLTTLAELETLLS